MTNITKLAQQIKSGEYPREETDVEQFFNDDGTVTGSGGPDVSVNPSLGLDQFNEYEFTAGVTDDGIGTPLDEFNAFQIKIVMRATNSARPPRIKDLRILALAT